MRKITICFIAILFLLTPIKVYASDTSVEIVVNGKVEKGETIDILVNVKSVENFYAASVDFIYNTDDLKVESIKATDFITKNINDIMEIGGETDKNGNTATYSFTFLGDKQGITGSGTLVKISAEVLDDKELSINEDNMKVKLVKRVGSTVENYGYKFVGYNLDKNSSSNSNTGTGTENGTDEKNEENNNENKDNSVVKPESNSSSGDNNSDNASTNNEQNNNNENNTTNEENVTNNNTETSNNNDKTEINKESSEKGGGEFPYLMPVVLVIGAVIVGGYYFYKKKNTINEKSDVDVSL